MKISTKCIHYVTAGNTQIFSVFRDVACFLLKMAKIGFIFDLKSTEL